jgi:hypothetical protein
MKFRHFLPIALLCGVLTGALYARAQVWSPWVKGTPVAAGGAAAGTCTQSTNFFNRAYTANGNVDLDVAHHNAYDTMICGLVTDTVWPLLDALWVPATASRAVANLNLVSSSYTLVEHPTPGTSPAWAANSGYTGGADTNTTVWLDTQLAPSAATQWTQNGAHLMVWTLNAAPQSTGYPNVAGAYGPTATPRPASQLTLWDANGAGQVGGSVNGDGGAMGTATPSNLSKGSFFWQRYAAAAGSTLLYFNSVSQVVTGAPASTPPVAQTMYLLNSNNNGTPGGGGPYQIGAVSMGANISANQISTPNGSMTGTGLIPRVCTYLTNIHGSC